MTLTAWIYPTKHSNLILIYKYVDARHRAAKLFLCGPVYHLFTDKSISFIYEQRHRNIEFFFLNKVFTISFLSNFKNLAK